MKIFFRALLMFCLSSIVGIALPSNQKSATETTLDINKKNIKKFNFNNIKDVTSVKKIKISYCTIKDKDFKNLFDKLKPTQTITLELAGIQLTEKIWGTICQNAQKINSLNINYLEESKINNWKNFIEKTTNLKRLYIHDYTNKNYSINELFKALTKLKNKIELRLKFKSINNEINLSDFVTGIQDNSIECIDTLEIYNPKISKQNVKEILKKLSTLKELSLAFETIDASAEITTQDLKNNLKNLEQLYINYTETISPDQFFEPQKWENSIDVDTLYINEYNIQALKFDNIKDISNLKKINIEYCNITQQQLEKLLKALSNNQKIVLKLAGIEITKNIWETICNNAKKINKLDLTFNDNIKSSSININKNNLEKKSISIRSLWIYDDNFTINDLRTLLAKIINQKVAQNKIPLKRLFLNCKQINKEAITSDDTIKKQLSNLNNLYINKDVSAYNYDKVSKILHLPPKSAYYPLNAEEKSLYETAVKKFLLCKDKNFKRCLPKNIPNFSINHRKAHPAGYSPERNIIYFSPNKAKDNHDLAEMIILHELGHAQKNGVPDSSTLSEKKYFEACKICEKNADIFSVNHCSTADVACAGAQYFKKNIKYDKYLDNNDPHLTYQCRTKLFEKTAEEMKKKKITRGKSLKEFIEEEKANNDKEKTKNDWWNHL